MSAAKLISDLGWKIFITALSEQLDAARKQTNPQLWEQQAYIPTIFQLCFQTLSDCFLFLRILPECFSFVKKEMFLTA